MDVIIAEKKYPVSASYQQIMNLFISIYENAALKNSELLSARTSSVFSIKAWKKKTRELEEPTKIWKASPTPSPTTCARRCGRSTVFLSKC